MLTELRANGCTEVENSCEQRRPFKMVKVPATQSECVTNTEFISPRNRETDVFDIGYLISQLRWHLRVAVFCSSDADEKYAKTCIARILPLLSSVLPEQRGGEAYKLADNFRKTWNTLHTELFAEASHAAFTDRTDMLEIADVVQCLRPFSECVDESIFTELMVACRDNERLLRALHLGRCVGEGLYPTLSDDAFFEVVDNPEFAQWISTASGTGFSFTPQESKKRQPPSKLIRPKRIDAGEFEPDLTWSNELRSLLAAIGFIGPLPMSLDHLGQTPDLRSEAIQKLSASIRAHFQVASSQGTDGEVS